MYRFDCGTGIGVITTENVAELGEWSTVTVHRKDWSATVRLNDGPEARGRSTVGARYVTAVTAGNSLNARVTDCSIYTCLLHGKVTIDFI